MRIELRHIVVLILLASAGFYEYKHNQKIDEIAASSLTRHDFITDKVNEIDLRVADQKAKMDFLSEENMDLAESTNTLIAENKTRLDNFLGQIVEMKDQLKDHDTRIGLINDKSEKHEHTLTATDEKGSPVQIKGQKFGYNPKRK